jgi:hypothetical protein
MGESLYSGAALLLLGRLFRERRSGVLTLGRAEDALAVIVRDGHVFGVRLPRPPAAAQPPRPGPDDSAQRRLDRVLAEVGIRPSASRPRRQADAAGTSLRERLVAALIDGRDCAFEDGAAPPEGTVEVAGATEPLILEALARLRDHSGIRDAIGDLDQRLVATRSPVEGRTLTLAEGGIFAHVDGVATGREVLERVPAERAETERTLLGLLLTGRLECRPPLPRIVPRASQPEAASPLEAPQEHPAPAVDAPVSAAHEAGGPGPPEADTTPAEAETPTAPVPPLDPAAIAQRREILDIFQALPLRNHFEVLGVERGCSDADVKRAYIALAKRFHPDVYRDPTLHDLHDVLEAIFIRIGEAWEVLGDGASRNAYAAGLSRPRPPARGPSDHAWVSPEETLLNAQQLIAQARYWDAIQLLEAAVPRMDPGRARCRGRILLARAYAKNPNWLRRAEETLQSVVRDDPSNADAHYELGLLYKTGGLAARAQAMFRRAIELRPDHREAAAELGSDPPPPAGLLKRLFGRGKAS